MDQARIATVARPVPRPSAIGLIALLQIAAWPDQPSVPAPTRECQSTKLQVNAYYSDLNEKCQWTCVVAVVPSQEATDRS